MFKAKKDIKNLLQKASLKGKFVQETVLISPFPRIPSLNAVLAPLLLYKQLNVAF